MIRGPLNSNPFYLLPKNSTLHGGAASHQHLGAAVKVRRLDQCEAAFRDSALAEKPTASLPIFAGFRFPRGKNTEASTVSWRTVSIRG